MSSPQEQMRALIRRCPYESMHRDRIANELLGIASYFHFTVGLVDQVDGMRVGLLCRLEGNLPVSISGQVYHIPIAIIFPEKYPMVAPLLKVCPTPNMNIRASQYVNAGGQISHQSLTTWTANSSLRFVLNELAAVFGQQCPVYINARYQILDQAVETANTRILDKCERLKASAGEECKELEAAQRKLQTHQDQLQTALKHAIACTQAAREKRSQLEDHAKKLDEKLLHQAYPAAPENASECDSIQPKEPLRAAMLRLVAEELAISDTIFVLEEMMNRKQTAGEACLKELKSMYAKQFLVWKKQEKAERLIAARQ